MTETDRHQARVRVLENLRHAMASPQMAAHRGPAAVAPWIAEIDADGLLTAAEMSRLALCFDNADYAEARRRFIQTVKQLEDVARAAIGVNPHGGAPAPTPVAKPNDLAVLEQLMGLHRLHKERRPEPVAPAGERPSGRPGRSGPPSSEDEWDVFVSFASEDNDAFVRDLAHALRTAGLRVWYDEFRLGVGDPLHAAINAGIAKSRYGVVILSPNYLKKEWPLRELSALSAREADGLILLMVWHNVTGPLVRSSVPLLADRLATSSHLGLDRVVQDLLNAMTPHP